VKSDTRHSFTTFMRVFAVCALCAVVSLSAFAQSLPENSIVMVCEHGSVKSLIAASIFNRRAKERGLPFHAISRGVNPDATVPEPIAKALGRDGFDVSHFVPTLATAEDLTSARRVVAIGIDLSAIAAAAAPSTSRWDDVPAASVDYAAARASIEKHIELLLDELAGNL
jgi:arsenate reductase (thioredoxin)